MTTITKPTTPTRMALSGLYYPNRMAQLYITALEEVMGVNGLHAILNLAGLQQYIENPPGESLNREFDFAHFTALNIALEDMYGPRGGRGLALRGGRVCFTRGLRNFGALAGAGDLAFKVLPLPAKLKLGLPALASIFTNFSDQHTTLEEHDDHYLYIMHQCPVCWGRTAEAPVCHVAVGVIQEGLRWVSGGREFRVLETKCHARGDEHCACLIYKQPIG